MRISDWSSDVCSSDLVAYDHHDIDDGLRAGLLTVADLDSVPHVAAVFHDVRARYPEIEMPRLIHESMRRLIDITVRDILDETRRRLAAAAPRAGAEIRALAHPVLAFSDEVGEKARARTDYLFRQIYPPPP